MGEGTVAGKECGANNTAGSNFIAYPNRETHLGDLQISRALPIRDRRLIGPWCFLDRFGPLSFTDEKPLDVLLHPHIGLQTVTWLLEGEVLHTDSLNSEAIARPGGVNLMTAGKGIAHAEKTPSDNNGRLNGVQLWVALPEEKRSIDPSFISAVDVPVIETRGGLLHIFAGSLDDIACPLPYYSDILGVQARIHASENLQIELKSTFEHAVLLLEGDCTLDGQLLKEKMLYALGTNRESLSLSSQEGSTILLIGGKPFPEKILMWWNFVARTPEEIAQARADWEGHRRFGVVQSENQRRLSAPDLVRFAQPNPIS
jgi:redox-sensitive bicupin YhaK (pirin superfamily)